MPSVQVRRRVVIRVEDAAQSLSSADVEPLFLASVSRSRGFDPVDGGRAGGTTGLMDLSAPPSSRLHRFCTVRMADPIIMIHDGRVAETGDHAILTRQRALRGVVRAPGEGVEPSASVTHATRVVTFVDGRET
ncbi:hypothetical protein AB0H12_43990 [Actinosynnema sp. NPDC023794]